MQSSDTPPIPSPCPYPKPKISLLDLQPPPDHLTDEESSKHMADQMGMTVEEFRAYLDNLPRR